MLSAAVLCYSFRSVLIIALLVECLLLSFALNFLAFLLFDCTFFKAALKTLEFMLQDKNTNKVLKGEKILHDEDPLSFFILIITELLNSTLIITDFMKQLFL